VFKTRKHLTDDANLDIEYIGLATKSALLQVWEKNTDKSYEKEAVLGSIYHRERNSEAERPFEASRRDVYKVFCVVCSDLKNQPDGFPIRL
jgi:hypothetical protein